MIDLKDRPDIGWNTLLVVSIIGIGVSIWFGFVAPVGSVPSSVTQHLNEQRISQQRDRNAKRDEQKLISVLTWNGSEEAVGSAVLDSLSTLAEKHSVQFTGLRTDKSNVVANLREAPFVVIVEGEFPDVVAFAHALEEPSSKLAVNLVQMSASDTSPGRVTATFGLLGFLDKEAK